MQRKHVVVLAGEDFIAGLSDQFVSLIVKPLAWFAMAAAFFKVA
jgi:hypothetical protein